MPNAFEAHAAGEDLVAVGNPGRAGLSPVGGDVVLVAVAVDLGNLDPDLGLAGGGIPAVDLEKQRSPVRVREAEVGARGQALRKDRIRGPGRGKGPQRGDADEQGEFRYRRGYVRAGS